MLSVGQMTLLAVLKSTLQFAILLDGHLIYFRFVQPGFMSLQGGV